MSWERVCHEGPDSIGGCPELARQAVGTAGFPPPWYLSDAGHKRFRK